VVLNSPELFCIASSSNGRTAAFEAVNLGSNPSEASFFYTKLTSTCYSSPMKRHIHLKTVEYIVDLLDNKFAIGKFRFGLDPIIGLIPGIGDFLPLIISGYIIFIAVQEKLSQKVITQMVIYTLLDFVLGSIPIIGDVADFFYKSHTKNLELLKRELDIPVIIAD
jgi:hypothetical protein